MLMWPSLARWIISNTTRETETWEMSVIPPREPSLIASLIGSFVNTVLSHGSFPPQSLQTPSVMLFDRRSCRLHLLVLFSWQHLLIKKGSEWGWGCPREVVLGLLRTEGNIRQEEDTFTCWRIWTWKVRPEGGLSSWVVILGTSEMSVTMRGLRQSCADRGIRWQAQWSVTSLALEVLCDKFTKEFSFHPEPY